MRTATRNLTEAQVRERMAEETLTRIKEGDRLVESLIRRPNLGKGLSEAYAKDPNRVRNLAFIIRESEKHLRGLTESQISAAFKTTPENVLRVLRLGYLNTSRQDAFWEIGLQTARDVFYHLEPVYGKTLRGNTAGKVMYEDPNYRSVTDAEIVAAAQTSNGVITTFTVASVAAGPLRPYTVLVLLDGAIIGRDNGRGVLEGDDFAGTINYETGAISVTFGTAPATGKAVAFEVGLSLEADSDLVYTQEAQARLRATPFTLREYPIYASFSKMTSLLLGTTLDIDAEDAYLRMMADELRKALDFQAFHMAYRQAKRNANGTPVEFDLNGAVGESEVDRIQAVTRYIGKVGNKFYSELLRGGVAKIFGGPDAVDVLTMHDKWSSAGAQTANGIHKLGMLGNIDVFKAPTTVVPNDELVCVYKNPDQPEDAFMVIGTLVPMHVTDKLELPNRNTEFGVASYGDIQIVNKQYAQILKINNLS